MSSNKSLCHDFFYDLNGYKSPKRTSVWYAHNVFYSYSTAICRIFTTNSGENVVLFSETKFSNTTAKHLRFLEEACPFRRYYAFFNIDGHASEDELLNRNVHILEVYATSKLTQKANREVFKKAFYALENFLEFEEFKGFSKEIKNILKKYQSIKDALDDKEALKALNKKLMEKEKKKKEQAEKKRQAFLRKFKNLSFIEKVKLAYCSGLDYETTKELKQALNPDRDLSFCWIVDNKIRTTQGVTVNLKEALPLLKAWKAGMLKHGEEIDRYTVLSVSKDFVKIGCHKIPTENLTELCQELNI